MGREAGETIVNVNRTSRGSLIKLSRSKDSWLRAHVSAKLLRAEDTKNWPFWSSLNDRSERTHRRWRQAVHYIVDVIAGLPTPWATDSGSPFSARSAPGTVRCCESRYSNSSSAKKAHVCSLQRFCWRWKIVAEVPAAFWTIADAMSWSWLCISLCGADPLESVPGRSTCAMMARTG